MTALLADLNEIAGKQRRITAVLLAEKGHVRDAEIEVAVRKLMHEEGFTQLAFHKAEFDRDKAIALSADGDAWMLVIRPVRVEKIVDRSRHFEWGPGDVEFL